MKSIFYRRQIPATTSKVGLTIVELLIYMAILSILIFVVTDIFASVLNVQLRTEATSSVEQDNRYLLARLKYDIARATSVTTPAVNGQTSTNLQLVIAGSTYSYALNNNNLILTTGANNFQLNSYNSLISNLSVTRLGNPAGRENTLTVSMVIASRTRTESGSPSAILKTTLALRRN